MTMTMTRLPLLLRLLRLLLLFLPRGGGRALIRV